MINSEKEIEIPDFERTDGVEGEDYEVLHGLRYYYRIDSVFGKVLPATYRMNSCKTADYSTAVNDNNRK